MPDAKLGRNARSSKGIEYGQKQRRIMGCFFKRLVSRPALSPPSVVTAATKEGPRPSLVGEERDSPRGAFCTYRSYELNM